MPDEIFKRWNSIFIAFDVIGSLSIVKKRESE